MISIIFAATSLIRSLPMVCGFLFLSINQAISDWHELLFVDQMSNFLYSLISTSLRLLLNSQNTPKVSMKDDNELCPGVFF